VWLFALAASLPLALGGVVGSYWRASRRVLAGATLDGIPENAALGVTLVSGGSVALLAGIFASNLPEALAGSAQMRSDGVSRAHCAGIWSGTAFLLGTSVVLGHLLLRGSSETSLLLPLAFAPGGRILLGLAAALACLRVAAHRLDEPPPTSTATAMAR
jgi:hypothetical protein